MYPREMETGSKERDGGGEGKSLAYERGSVRGERFCVIINRIVSTCTGNVLRMIMKKHLSDVLVEQIERGANLESRAAHTYPKNTQVPPPLPEINGLQTLQHHQQETSRRFIALSYVLQVKQPRPQGACGFYRQNHTCFPRIYLSILHK